MGFGIDGPVVPDDRLGCAISTDLNDLVRRIGVEEVYYLAVDIGEDDLIA